jgi:hypothetical protein
VRISIGTGHPSFCVPLPYTSFPKGRALPHPCGAAFAEVATWQTQEWPSGRCAYAYMPAKVHGVTL